MNDIGFICQPTNKLRGKGNLSITAIIVSSETVSAKPPLNRITSIENIVAIKPAVNHKVMYLANPLIISLKFKTLSKQASSNVHEPIA